MGHQFHSHTHTHGTLPCVPVGLASQGFYKHGYAGFSVGRAFYWLMATHKKEVEFYIVECNTRPSQLIKLLMLTKKSLTNFFVGRWDLDTKGVLTPDGIITDVHSGRHDGRGGGDVLGIQLVQRVTEVISHDRSRWMAKSQTFLFWGPLLWLR